MPAVKPTFDAYWNRFAGPAFVLLAAIVATAPFILQGPSCGSDLYFHLASWIEAQRSMLLAVPYPHWTPNSNFGAGEPRFVFYPPLSWMAGAFLGLFMPWRFVAVAFTFLLFAATGLANRALAREMLSDGPATLAGCAAIFSGFALLTVYTRSDFAEITAGFWIPLLILFLLRDRNPSGPLRERAFDGSAAPLALVLAGAWLSNAPVGLMASYLLAALAVVAALIAKSWAPVLRATVAALLAFGLAAGFLLPAAWEQRWTNLQFAISIPHLQVRNSWLFARHTDATLAAVAHDQKLLVVSWIAVAMIAVALAGALVAHMRGALLVSMRGSLPGARRWTLPLLLIPCAVLFLMLPVSMPVWNVLPKLRYLQFSWRWLEVMTAPTSIFFAAAVWFVPLRRRIAVLSACALLFIAISAAAGHYWFIDCEDNQDRIVAAEHDGTGVYGKQEYAPAGGIYAPPLSIQPDACLVGDPSASPGPANPGTGPYWDGAKARCKAFVAINFLPESRIVVGTADHPGYLILRLRSYPAWRVEVNGRPVTPAIERDFGLMAVPVPQGHIEINIDWTTTPDVIAGRCISFVSVLALTTLCLIERKLRRPRLS
jgi:hypothetical protein